MNEESEKEKKRQKLSLGWQLICTEVLEESRCFDRYEEDHEIDCYWSLGWTTGYYEITRSNYDYFAGRLHKVFPLRNRLRDVKFTKSLRRVLRKNKDLNLIIRPLRITAAKEKLYHDHHWQRHLQAPRERLSDKYKDIPYHPTDLKEVCVFDDSRLIACSIFEVGNRSIMANLAFWDVGQKHRSLGIFTILKEMEYARSLGIEYYYPGFFYTANPNYAYKIRFSGLEIFDWTTEGWLDFDNEFVPELLKQALPTRD